MKGRKGGGGGGGGRGGGSDGVGRQRNGYKQRQ